MILPCAVSFRAVRRIEIAVALSLFVEAVLYLAVIPLLPTYVDRFGLTTTQAALVMAVLPLMIVATSVPLGYLGSRIGNRRIVIGGNLLQTIATFVFAFAPNVTTLVAARAVQGLGSAVTWGAAIAWLTANAPVEQRGAYIGRAMGFVSAGSIAGPAIGALAGVTSIAWAFSAVAVAAIAATLATVAAPAGRAETGDGTLRQGLAASAREPLVIAGFALAMAEAVCGAAANLLAPLRLGALGYGAVAIGAALLVGSVGGLAAARPAGRLVDRVGARRVGTVAGATGVGTCLLLALQPGPAVIMAALAGLGVLFTFQATSVYPLATAGADRSGIPHGVVSGIINLSWSSGIMLGQLGAGVIADHVGESAAYLVVAAAIAALLGVMRRMAARNWRSPDESANVPA